MALLLIFALPLSSPVWADTEINPLAKAQKLDGEEFYNEAVVAWQEALKTNLSQPQRIYAQIKLSLAYFNLVDFENAQAWAKDLVKAFPENFHAAFNLATILSGTKNYKEATVHYSKAIEVNPEQGLSYMGLALCLFGSGDSESAKKKLYEVRKLFKKQRNIPWHRDATLMIAQIKHFAGYPPHFSDLWLSNNLKMVRDTYIKTLLEP